MVKLQIETEHREYKKSTAELNRGTDAIAAILNKHHGGTLYFGVKPDGEVIGQQISDKTLREVSQAIRDRVEPQISPTISIEEIGKRNCVKVEFSGNDTPYSSSNVYFIRVADENVKMSREQIEEFLHERYNRANPWDQRPSNKTVADVDEATLQNYVARGNKVGRISFEYDNSYDTLERLRLLDGNRLLNAGRLCFCEPSCSLIKMAVFAGRDNSSTILDMKRDDGNLFSALRAGWQYVLKNTRQRFEFKGGPREEIPEIPTAAVTEAIVNALCHRLWDDTMDVSVTVFSDRVEVFSPGAFPVEVEPEDLLFGRKIYSKSRNQLLADTLYKSKDIESFGTGLHRIQTLCDEANIQVEVVRETWGFTVIFHRPDWQKDFDSQNDLEYVLDTRLFYSEISKHADSIVMFMKNVGKVSASDIEAHLNLSRPQVNRILKTMVEKGLIRRIGSGPSTRYLLMQ
jgi:ATP-dependent DNA helicase RecG